MWLFALLGGAMIGIASALLLVTHGRVAGISGIVAGSLFEPEERDWRVAFIVGLLASGMVAAALAPAAVEATARPLSIVIVAGVLVGFGTRLGGGCTSGHGVCGLGRRSQRSLVAVATFMTAGAITTWLAGGAS